VNKTRPSKVTGSKNELFVTKGTKKKQHTQIPAKGDSLLLFKEKERSQQGKTIRKKSGIGSAVGNGRKACVSEHVRIVCYEKTPTGRRESWEKMR